ncbi:hypothetical protein WMF30_35135 [Sorangium sp. So ce134]
MSTGIAAVESSPHLHACRHTHFCVEDVGAGIHPHPLSAREIKRTSEGLHRIVSRARVIVTTILPQIHAIAVDRTVRVAVVGITSHNLRARECFLAGLPCTRVGVASSRRDSGKPRGYE